MLYQQIARNKRKTILVMFGFFVLLALIGAAIGYLFARTVIGGMIIAAIIAVIYMSVIIGQSTDVVMRMNNATEVRSASDAPELWHIVEDMALVARVPMPKVYIIHDPSPNAFATGNDPEHAAVAATTGLMEKMNREELEGVMAHEMTHVRNYDIRLQTIALALASAIAMLVNFAGNFWWIGGRSSSDDRDNPSSIFAILGSILLIILAPLAATIAQMALSRNREYLADAFSLYFPSLSIIYNSALQIQAAILLPPFLPLATIYGTPASIISSLDCTTLTKPTGTPMTNDGEIFFS